MKLAIISDIHDNIPNLQKVLDYCQQKNIKQIIACGDFGGEEVLAKLAEFDGEVFGCLGNMDRFKDYFNDVKDKYPNLTLWENVGEKVFDNLNLAFTHEPQDAKVLVHPPEEFEKAEYSYIFYGHTHKPWEEVIDGVHVINPGNVAGQRYPATFATFETETRKLDLIIIDQLS